MIEWLYSERGRPTNLSNKLQLSHINTNEEYSQMTFSINNMSELLEKKQSMSELFEKIKKQLEKHPHTDSSVLLANAMASACNSSYGVSMLECSIILDSDSKELLWGLANVRSLPGYSNAVQDSVLRWLRDNEYIV